MTTTTAILNLLKALDDDNSRTYLTVDLAGSLDILDALFHASTGHTHDGTAGDGAPVAALAPGSVGTDELEDGAVTPAKIANRTRVAFIPAAAFQPITGSPSFAAHQGHGVWLLDAASNEAVASGWEVPADWASGALTYLLVVSPVTSGSLGNREVVLLLQTSVTAAGSIPAAGSASDTVSTDANSGGLTRHTHSRTDTPTAAGQAVGLAVQRTAADAADDLAGDLRFYGVAVSYTADS